MKTCPFCAEEIQELAVLCRYCKMDVTGKDLFSKQPSAESPDAIISSASQTIAPSNRKILAMIIAIVILAIAYAILDRQTCDEASKSHSPSDESSGQYATNTSSRSAVDVIGTWVQLNGGYVMAPSKELFNKADDIVRSKDEQATKILMLSGQLKFTSTVKEEVYVENIQSWSGYAQVRLKGSTTTWWTNAEAVLGNY